MSYKVIVAKYNEDVNWLSKVNIEHFIIYDKGTSAIPNCVAENQIIKRRNLGREVESFIYYIITNYDNLPDYIIFLQGKPFDHLTPEVIEDNIQQKIEDLIVSANKTTSFYSNNGKCHDFPEFLTEKIEELKGFNLKSYFRFILNKEVEDTIDYSASCQYLTMREDILKKPIEFYKNLNAILINGEPDFSIAHYKPKPFDPFRLSGWEFERLMYYVLVADSCSEHMKSRRCLVTSDEENVIESLLERGNIVVYISNEIKQNVREMCEKYPTKLQVICGDVKDSDTIFLAGFVDEIF